MHSFLTFSICVYLKTRSNYKYVCMSQWMILEAFVTQDLQDTNKTLFQANNSAWQMHLRTSQTSVNLGSRGTQAMSFIFVDTQAEETLAEKRGLVIWRWGQGFFIMYYSTTTRCSFSSQNRYNFKHESCWTSSSALSRRSVTLLAQLLLYLCQSTVKQYQISTAGFHRHAVPRETVKQISGFFNLSSPLGDSIALIYLKPTASLKLAGMWRGLLRTVSITLCNIQNFDFFPWIYNEIKYYIYYEIIP